MLLCIVLRWGCLRIGRGYIGEHSFLFSPAILLARRLSSEVERVVDMEERGG
jgi:hypothetical protein